MKKKIILIFCLSFACCILASCKKAPPATTIGSDSAQINSHLKKDSLPNIFKDSPSTLKKILHTSKGDVNIDAFVNIPNVDRVKTYVQEARDPNIEKETLVEKLFGKNIDEMKNLETNFENIYFFQEGNIRLYMDLRPEDYAQSIVIELCENQISDLTPVEQIQICETSRADEALLKYGVTFENLQSLSNEATKQFVNPIRPYDEYQINEIMVGEYMVDGVKSYSFELLFRPVIDGIPAFGHFLLIGDSNIISMSDVLRIKVTSGKVYNISLAGFNKITKTLSEESRFITLDEVLNLAEKSSIIFDPIHQTNLDENLDYTIKEISFIYLTMPPPDPQSKILSDTNNKNDRRYTEVTLIPFWHFRSAQPTQTVGDFYNFVVNAITGEIYTYHY